MSTRWKAYVLVALVAVLGWVLLGQFRNPKRVTARRSAAFVPINVADPTLRIDDIVASQKREYTGSGRNIFAYGRVAEPPRPTIVDTGPGPMVNPEPPKKPAVTPQFKFYGIATNPATGRRRAFFTNGDDIWIAEEGQMIDRRFRLLKIGNTNAEVEEASSGERATLPLEELPGSG